MDIGALGRVMRLGTYTKLGTMTGYSGFIGRKTMRERLIELLRSADFDPAPVLAPYTDYSRVEFTNYCGTTVTVNFFTGRWTMTSTVSGVYEELETALKSKTGNPENSKSSEKI